MQLKNILIVLTIAVFSYFVIARLFELNPEIAGVSPTDIKLGESFTVKIGQAVELEGGKIKIKFVDVSDSRCPSGVQCIWAGQVRIALNVDYPENNYQKIDLILGAGASDENSKVIGGYIIKLLNVEPYPSGGKIEKTDYIASLNISH